MKLMSSVYDNIRWLLVVLCAFLTIFTGSTAVNAATTNGSHFDVKHTKGSNSPKSVSNINPNAQIIEGGSCGNTANNTGWVNYYSSDRTALLQLCTFDAGSHKMVTYVRVYNFYGDNISSAYALATYDDGQHDSDDISVGGVAAQAYMQVEHTFSSGGLHTVTVDGGFFGYESEGSWSQKQSLTLN
ncbi:MAG: hypothetical protein ACXVPC_02630 [Tumebacillaceae bacterium]